MKQFVNAYFAPPQSLDPRDLVAVTAKEYTLQRETKAATHPDSLIALNAYHQAKRQAGVVEDWTPKPLPKNPAQAPGNAGVGMRAQNGVDGRSEADRRQRKRDREKVTDAKRRERHRLANAATDERRKALTKANQGATK